MTDAPMFHVVDRGLAEGEPQIAQDVPTSVWLFAIYKRTGNPNHKYGELIALMHDAGEADLVARGLNACRAHTMAMMGVSSTPVREKSPAAWMYLSHCPAGYDTILGYLAKHHPTRLELIDQKPEATQRDGYWCMHRAHERGIKIVKVRAPAFLADEGIEFVNAYPTTLLRERLD